MKTQGYSIKDLEVLSGIKAHTIRIWEKRYELLRPNRTDTNIRFYDDQDLKRLLNVSVLVNSGHKISKVSNLSEQEIKSKILEVAENKTSESDYVDRLVMQMLNFENIGFEQEVDKIIDLFGLEEAFYKVFFLFYERIGIYWQVGSIFPAQEHFVSNIFRQKLIASINNLEMVIKKDAKILFFLPEGELHEMSLLFYSYLARKHGYEIIYLGQMVPFDDLISIQSNLKISFVFTSFINAISKENLESYLEKLKEIFTDQKVFITGWQVRHHEPSLPRNVKIVRDYREFKKFLR